MPELPDVSLYVEALQERVAGKALERVRLASPFLVRSVNPPVRGCERKRVTGVRRIGKQIVFAFEDELFLVIHLMIAGRLHWKPKDAKVAGKIGLAAFDFESGTLVFTEAGTKKRASLHCVHGESSLAQFNRGGIEPLTCNQAAFRAALTREDHTLKRALTDPTILSGIGNSYSDEILHRARMSPTKRTPHLSTAEFAQLRAACRDILTEWTDRLRKEAAGAFPEKVTAFRDGMAVHGRYGKPCPDCGAPVKRIVHGEHETNYCAPCQTSGKLLADRALSRLLGRDWPRSLEAMEAHQEAAKRILHSNGH